MNSPEASLLRLLQATEVRLAGDLSAARGLLDALLDADPDFLPARVERASVSDALGDYETALSDLEGFLRRFPGNDDIAALYGEILDRALRRQDETLRRQPADDECRLRRAHLRWRAGQAGAALADCRRLLAVNPWHDAALNLQGNCQIDLGRPEAAIVSYREALEVRDRPDYRFNLGNVLQQTARFDEARIAYRQVLEASPAFAEAVLEMAHCDLSTGDFAAGWAAHESRWQTAQLAPFAWRGERPRWSANLGPRPEATLLVWAEQGLGDAIQFLRYVAFLRPWVGRVVLRLPLALLDLAATLAVDCVRVADTDPLPEHDFQCSLLSLPQALNLAEPPAVGAYLHVDAQRSTHWLAELGPADRPRIGLAWAGRQGWRANPTRDLPFAELRLLLDLPFGWVSLQQGVPAVDAAAFDRSPLRRFPAFGNLADTAALIDRLALVITVDSVIAHLCGALGKPCWLLLRHASEWRWQRERSDSVWYPSLRLFRQARPGDWAGVVRQVGRTLLAADSPVASAARTM
ncbi:MAG: tetratricopeptide repeat protein [Azonexaceae bacterium]|nr:tetratricopeptide repeat protein [Azonexaceae bacterium]